MWTFSTYLGILTLCTAECLGMQMIFFYVCSSRLQFLIQKQTWRDKKFWTVMNSTEKETGNLQMIVSVEYHGLLNYGAKKVANLWSKSIITVWSLVHGPSICPQSTFPHPWSQNKNKFANTNTNTNTLSPRRTTDPDLSCRSPTLTLIHTFFTRNIVANSEKSKFH